MSDEPNTYEYIIKKQAFLNNDALNERIAELESANTFLKEQNDNLSFLSNRAGNVYRAQRLDDFLGFINDHLLSSDLEIALHEEDEEGLVFHIPSATLKDGIISRVKQSWTVTGHITLDWTVEVLSEDEDDAIELAERLIHDANITSYVSHEPDEIESCDIDDYNLTVEVTGSYPN
jgi:hypothetical protein